MKVINWLDVHPGELEGSELNDFASKKIPIRNLVTQFVIYILQQYPWENRHDLIPMYHPAEYYQKGDWIALPGSAHSDNTKYAWKIIKIKDVISTSNPHQGNFQVLTFESQGLSARAAGISDSTYALPDLSALSEINLNMLAESIVDSYGIHLIKPLASLINLGVLDGKISGQFYTPNQTDDLIAEFFSHEISGINNRHPWLSVTTLADKLKNLGTFKDMDDMKIVSLVESTLRNFDLLDLGNGYWTKETVYRSKIRGIPRGVPAPHIHNVIDIWTDDDIKQSVSIKDVSLPKDIPDIVDVEDEIKTPPKDHPWQPPERSLRLPTLTYLHITQAYFPVGKIIHAFQPGAKLIRIKLPNSDYQDFLLNRESGHLIAVNKGAFYTAFKEGPPAGSYLWLKYEDDNRYRVQPRKLKIPRPVQCKLVYLRDSRLIVENSEMLMEYEGNPKLFKADLRFIDIQAFFREARLSNLSVRDAIIQSIQEIAENDPDGAHISDIFNLVFLKRMCSPRFVSLLLYTQPCFKQLGNGFFQYSPITETTTNESKGAINEPSEPEELQLPVQEKLRDEMEEPLHIATSKPKLEDVTNQARRIPDEQVIDVSDKQTTPRENTNDLPVSDERTETQQVAQSSHETQENSKRNRIDDLDKLNENLERPDEKTINRENIDLPESLEKHGFFKRIIEEIARFIKNLITLFNRGG